MAQFHEVDPSSFIDIPAQLPATGRGAWTRLGIEIDYRFRLAPAGAPRVGTQAEKSLSHWAVSAGVYAVQKRLEGLGYWEVSDNDEFHGRWGSGTDRAFRAFQKASVDPAGGARLTIDGLCGRADVRALWTPLIDESAEYYNVPKEYLRGQANWESFGLDPAAVGYYIYYAVKYRKADGTYGTRVEFRGVDRGLSQINSLYNPDVTWHQAYDPVFSLAWSGKRLRTFYDKYKKANPAQDVQVLWDAAICAHNNPSAAALWAKNGFPPTEDAATYVSSVRGATY